MDNSGFHPGFRFSVWDGAILLAALLVTFVPGWLSIVLLPLWFVLGHFFLFCNVFRIALDLELTWAGVFVTAAALVWNTEIVTIKPAIGAVLLTTLLVLTIALRRPSYHGIGWRLINPRLPDWWAAEVRRGTRGT